MRNESLVGIDINSISWSDHTHFSISKEITFPFKILAEKSISIPVNYKPDELWIQHTDTAFFSSDATISKLYSVWSGIGAVTPQLLKPVKDTTNIAINVDIQWENLANTEYYKLQVAKEYRFQFPLLEITSPEHNYSYTFEKNTKYYWRVCAGDGENFGVWSEAWTFTTGDFSDVTNTIHLNNVFSIFPNPADNELYIEFSNDFSNNCEIEIIDMQGTAVSSIKKSNLIYGMNKEQISLKDLSIGTYCCVLQIGGNRYSKMFVKM
ncbi:MAG TPA: T9SS type A sorting domain-containing protein [Candidatus Kapabacteria bacterium]|nr:T9SS type A sorting domain-containing protein [Candidatus Kapabacteria bacterium]